MFEKQNAAKNYSVAMSVAMADGLMFAAHELTGAFGPFFADKNSYKEIADFVSLIDSLQGATTKIIVKANVESESVAQLMKDKGFA